MHFGGVMVVPIIKVFTGCHGKNSPYINKNSGATGFKNLTTFNLAMLGKQEWKLQFNPSNGG
jgi:hypothetical protein